MNSRLEQIMSTAHSTDYSPQEERINALTHALGALLALLGSIALWSAASPSLSAAQLAGLLLYGGSLILLFTASALYHHSRRPHLRLRLKQLDHAAIYGLIAGTYTPFLMISLAGNPKADLLLMVLWLIALLGVIFKIFFIHRFALLSLAAYLVMGWLALLILPEIRQALDTHGFYLLVAGGVSYTLGSVFYALKKLHYSHAIWHGFVLLGAALHFWAIYAYVLPH